jgi:hypothetical protein
MTRPALVLLALLVAAPLARAADPAPCARVAQIPGWWEVVPRQETVPAVYEERRQAICETVEEPIYETRCVPKYENFLEPVYETRRVPIYEKRRIPVFGDVDVPVTAVRRVPVKVPWFTGCSCEERMATLFHRDEEIRVGTRRERRMLGHREEQVQVGWRNERVLCREECRVRPCGWTTEEVCVGTRAVRRTIGWESNWVLRRPQTTRTVEERTWHPARAVTVVPDGAARQVLPGTTESLSESEYLAACAAATWPR